MLLSEAIRQGSSMRGESRSGPFTRIANTGELRSDVWGAACEAVHSLVAKRNWNRANQPDYDNDIAYLRDIQQQHFPQAFKVYVTCPGAQSRHYSAAGGRFTGRTVGGLNEFAVEGERVKTIGALTTACGSMTLAEFVEHAFYVHNWSREQCAQAVEHIEHGDTQQLVTNFDHYMDNSVVQRVNERLTSAARARERQRHARRAVIFN